jgi:hypothetical protein
VLSPRAVGRVHCIPRTSVPHPPFWLQLLVPGRLKQHRNQKRIRKRMWKIEERRAKGMEDFPVQVIGTILSHIAAVKQVVRASGTCRKWREAARNHLQTVGRVRQCTKPHNCTLGSVAHGDYPTNFSSARFVHLDPRRIFSGGDYFLALACSEFSSYSGVWIDGAELYQAPSVTCERAG